MHTSLGTSKRSLIVASACIGVIAAQASAAVVSWDGGTAGTGSVWASPLNWAGDALPQDGDSIVVANTSVAGVYVSGGSGTGREMYLNQSAGGNGGGTPFTGNPPSKSFRSITFGTADTSTTFLPASFTLYNGINSNYRVDNTVRLTGEDNGYVFNVDAGAANTNITVSSGSYGVTNYVFASTATAGNVINVATAGKSVFFNPQITGSGGLTKTGNGTFFLNNATNDIAGDYYVNAGNIGLGNGPALGATAKTVYLANGAGLVLDQLSGSTTIPASQTINLPATGVGRISVASGESWFVSGAVTGGALEKVGNGSLNLNGPLTYTGGTTITGGGLYINSVLNSGLTNATGTTLGGLGTINGNVAIGGTLLPGSSNAFGTLTINGNLTMANGSAGIFNAGLSTVDAVADVANVTGTFDISGSTLAIGTLAARSEAAIVIANYGSLVGDFGNVTGLLGGWTLDKNYNNTNKIALVRGNTKLYYSGAASGEFANAANFAIDPALTTSTTQYATASSDVYVDNGRPLASANATIGTGNTYVGSLTFSDSGLAGPTGFSINQANSGSGTLVIKASGLNYAAGVGILVTNGSATNTIGAPVSVANSQSWTNNGTGTLKVTGNVALGTNTLTLGGSGSTTIDGVVSGSGGLTASGAGTVTLNGTNTYTGVTTVDKSGGNLVLAPTSQTPVLGGTGGADIKRGGLVFENGDANLIRGLLAGSFTSPTTPGVMDSGQLRSSTATAARGLGYAALSNGQVIVKAALFGDADLDGGVSINDFNALAANFGQATGKVWVDGDFDYDGGVSINDFNLLAGGFGQSIPTNSDAWAGLLAFAAAHNDLVAFEAITGVPEPTSLGLLAAGATLGLRRRRA